MNKQANFKKYLWSINWTGKYQYSFKWPGPPRFCPLVRVKAWRQPNEDGINRSKVTA
jgi:hypothetical protein